MKNKVRSISIIIFISAFIIPILLGEQKAKWKGNIKVEDGAKTIINTDQPVFGELVLELEKNFILGTEKNEHDIFSLIWDVQADTQGNIYVSDFKDRRIKKFSSKGEYLYDVGRIGQGPGEFQGARNIFIDDETGDIYLADLMKVHRYDQEGQYQDSVAMNRYFRRFFVDAEKSFWAIAAYYDETGKGNAFEKISPQGELLRRIIKISPQDTDLTKPIGEGEVVAVVGPKHGFEYELIISRIDNRTCLWAVSNKYELNVIDINGDLLFKIRKQEAPQKFTRKEKNKILSRFDTRIQKNIKLPSFKPFFEEIISDSEGRIYIQRTPSPLSENEEYVYDIFSKDGHYLYSSCFTEEPVVIKNGLMYTLVRDPEISYQYVKGYQIKNWDQIKKVISK
ncbi:MAG: 6-bladed beta-propeller [Acidobacteriota bacterium]